MSCNLCCYYMYEKYVLICAYTTLLLGFICINALFLSWYVYTYCPFIYKQYSYQSVILFSIAIMIVSRIWYNSWDPHMWVNIMGLILLAGCCILLESHANNPLEYRMEWGARVLFLITWFCMGYYIHHLKPIDVTDIYPHIYVSHDERVQYQPKVLEILKTNQTNITTE